MKKVSVLHYASPPIIGGVEHTIFHHARLLRKYDYNVCVITGRGEQFLEGIPVIKLPFVDSRNQMVEAVSEELNRGEVTELFYSIRDQLISQLRDQISDNHACIVHNALSLHKNLPFTAALRILSDQKVTKFIGWCHDFAWEDELYASDMHEGYPWNLLREKWKEVKYVVVSEHRRLLLAKLLNISEEEIVVVSPGVDIFHFFRLTKETQRIVQNLDLFHYDPILLLPARITRRKNIQFALQVVAELKNSRPAVCLLITGPPGPHNPKNLAYLENLQKIVRDLGISNNVIFLYTMDDGAEPLRLDDTVVADLYQIADILLFPSLREGFGIPILEAGIARMPVFASDIPPFKESSAGYIHTFDPSGYPDSVAKNINNHLDNDFAYQLKKRVYQEYTWEEIVKKRLVPLIESV